jgi:hypothetical protein
MMTERKAIKLSLTPAEIAHIAQLKRQYALKRAAQSGIANRGAYVR